MLPALSFSDHTIWGISYLILRELYLQLDGVPFKKDRSINGEFLPPYPYGKKL
jgi:hypothetical protein